MDVGSAECDRLSFQAVFHVEREALSISNTVRTFPLAASGFFFYPGIQSYVTMPRRRL